MTTSHYVIRCDVSERRFTLCAPGGDDETIFTSFLEAFDRAVLLNGGEHRQLSVFNAGGKLVIEMPLGGMAM